MLVGIHGTFLSRTFAKEQLHKVFAGRTGSSTLEVARDAFARWRTLQLAPLCPVSGLRTMLDAACGLAECLTFDVGESAILSDVAHCARLHALSTDVCLISTAFGGDLNSLWRQAVRHSIVTGARWALCFNGTSFRLVDVRRSYSRTYLEFELTPTLTDPETFRVFWAVLRAEAFIVTGSSPSLLDEIRAQSARHAEAVCLSLRVGVREALVEMLQAMVGRRTVRARTDRHLQDELEQALTVIYRVLFLLFAEARGLVPLWHPIYRRSYAVEALRDAIESSKRTPGLWESLLAMSRLAHDGCRAGSLKVTPFNGRLFAPEHTPLAERLRPDDEVIRRMLLALSTRPAGPGGRERIAYQDLGVEQLGAVYESVLDYRPELSAPAGRRSATNRASLTIVMRPGSGGRKASGTFYTPRSITDFLVRRTLSPLVAGASSDALLQIKVVDPAMGSGAFLVAACRYLAAAYETALIREGRVSSSEVTDEERSGFRRLVAQRCLFGVDLNPTAVHLARLSIWLVTLARDQPLTFLDHHLLSGNSLLGVTLEDVTRRAPPGHQTSRSRPATFPLFEGLEVEHTMREVLALRSRMALDPDDTPAAVRSKEETLKRLRQPDTSLARSKAACDLWCACWFWPSPRDIPGSAVFGELMNTVFTHRSALPDGLLSRLLSKVRAVTASRRFFHWNLEFPEAFFDQDGRPLPSAGFDAVIGNPPWDVLRADPDGSATRTELAATIRFVRDSGVYALSRDGHANSYQLFIERALTLLRPGGRLGLVVPSGLATDAGSSALRRHLLQQCDTDMVVGFDNRRRIFPIHRGMRFLLTTSTTGSATSRVVCRFGEHDPTVLDSVGDLPQKAGDAAFPVSLTPGMIHGLSGDSLVIPDLRGATDVRIHEGIASRSATLGAEDGWNLRFGRELNATDDRKVFSATPRAIAIVEGKHVAPFHVELSKTRYWMEESRALTLMGSSCPFGRPRLAYRDVASAANRLTLIAAVLPARTLSTHTVFCLKTELDRDLQLYLCGMFNSYVANYLIRARVSMHVTVASIRRLPVPFVAAGTQAFGEVVELTKTLMTARGQHQTALARLQAVAAGLYGVTRDEFAHVLSTFPLIAEEEKGLALKEFDHRATDMHRR